ncbi:MAG: zinc ribbon domain-containing protein, partial [Tenericutes bacterium]|nr:zinc ribbon domain-containing protein [Mycoplasmatota bacterium]
LGMVIFPFIFVCIYYYNHCLKTIPIQCGTCEKAYHFKVNNINTKYAKRILICSQNREKIVCSNDRIFADVFDKILLEHINVILKDKKSFLNTLRKALLSHPAIINLNNELNQTQEKLKAINFKLNQFEDVEDEHGISIKRELVNNQYSFSLELARIRNLLLTTYNIDNILIHYKKLLKPYKKPITNIEDFPFKAIFNRSIIHSREKITFDIVIDPSNKIPIYSTEPLKTEYLIRKTEHETTSQIRIY